MIAAVELRLTLDGNSVLDGVSFGVARGESVALVGPNGSGKTSIIRCLLGLVPFTGRAAIHGYDVVREPVAARGKVGYVPQHAAFGEGSALEVLMFVAKLRRLDPLRIGAALREVGLEAHARQRVRTFSGGMQQRLSLAVALLAECPVLLFDEPSASLDRDGQVAFFEIVARLRRRGHTMILASHRREEVEALTDRVLHVDRGRLAGAPERGARVIPLPMRLEGR